MADGVSLGSAELTLDADLAPLRAKLDAAKAKVATAVGEMQAMLDTLHADVDFNTSLGSLAGLSAVDRGGVSSLEHLAATADLTSALREHTEVTRNLLAASSGERGGETLVTGVGGHTSGIYGVRGTSAPGSIANPMVVVMEAASRTPLGSLAAAVGNDTISQGDQRTVVATTQGSETRVAAAGAPGAATERQATDILAADASRGGGTPNVSPGGNVTSEARPSESGIFQALANLEAAKALGGTPGSTPVGVTVMSTDPSVSKAEGDATALAMEDALAKLAGKSLAPGQRASQDLLAGYPAFGYRIGTSPSGPYPRLYGPGGKVGSTDYGAYPGTEGGHGGLDALLASSGGKGGGGGGGFHLGGGIGPFRWSSGGGGKGGESTLRNLLYGSGFLPATAGLGTLGSFAGFGPEHILLTLGGMAGSGVAALGGGALLAGGAAAKLGAGMGSDFAVGSSAVADTASLYKNYEKLREAVAQYGKASSQAKEAQEELTDNRKYTLSGTKGVTEELHLAEKVSALNVQWDKETSGARVAFVHLAEPLIEISSKWIPLINTSAEHNFASMSSNLKPFFSFLKGPEAMGIFQQLENEFHAEIPTAMQALDQGFQVFGKTVAYTAPLTGKLLEDVDHFFTKLNTPSGFAKWEGMMTRLIGDFNVWKVFLKELGGALVDLFDKDAKTGESIIETLTVMLHHVREYEQSVTGGANISNIFEVHREEIIALIKAIAPLGDAFSHIYMTVAPPLVEIVTHLAEGLDAVVKALEKLGPAGEWLVGLTALAGKLKVLVPLLEATKKELFGTATAQGEAAAAASAQARAEALAAGATEEDAAAAASAAAANAGLADAQGASAGGSAGAAKGLLSGAGEGGLTSLLLRGGLTTIVGALGGSLLANLTKAQGTLHTSLTTAGAGAGAGFVLGPAAGALLGTEIAPGLGTAIGAGIGFASPYVIKGIGDLFNAGHAAMERESAHVARSAISMLGTTITSEIAGKRGGEVGKLLGGAAILRAGTKEEGTPRRVSGVEKVAGAAVDVLTLGIGSAMGHGFIPKGSEADIASALEKERKAGELAAEAFHEGFEHVRFPTTFGFLHMALGELDKLTPEARRSAAQTMIAYAAELEHQGKLGKGSVEVIIKDLEHEFPQLEAYLRAHGHSTGIAFADALSLKAAQESLHGALHSIEMEWGLTYSNIAQTEKDLLYTIQHTHGVEKELAEQELKEVQTKYATQWRERAQLVKNSAREQEEAIHRLSVNMPNLGAPGFEKYGEMVTRWGEHLGERVANGVETLSQGVSEMNKMLEGELTALGAPKSVGHALVTGKMPTAKQFFKEGLAGGGLMQIGQPGTAGHDTVPLNVGGHGIMVGEGEQVAVFNRHQLPIVNEALAGIGGLPGLFSQVTTPNYMASGGIVAPTVPGHGAMTAVVRAGLADVAKAANAKAGKASGHASAKGGGGRAGGRTSAGGSYNRSQLEALWISAGGSPSMAHIMAAIALAESSGNAGAESSYSDNGSHAQGLWQIEMPMNSADVPGGNAFNALANAKGAVKILASQGLGAWETYTKGMYEAFMAHGGLLHFARGGLPGFAGGGGLPHVIGSHAQKTTPVPRNFGAKAKKNPKSPAKPKTYTGSLTLPWNPSANKSLYSLGQLLETGIPYVQEEYQNFTNQFSLKEYGSGELGYILTEGPLGESVTPYEDLANVEGRLGQLHVLSGIEGHYKELLQQAVSSAGMLHGWVEHEIAARHKTIAELEKKIKKIRHEIEQNVKRVRALNKRLQTLQHPPKGVKVDKKAVASVQAEVKALEHTNAQLGGDTMDIGSGGILGKLETERSGAQSQLGILGERRGALGEDVKTIQGVTGNGGSLGEAMLTLSQLGKQEEELGTSSMAKALAKAKVQAGPGSAEQELTSLLKQQNEQLAAQFAVSQDQYKVLANLPPFGGSFASGGIVPGPPGAPRLVVAHGGEGIGAPGGAQVHMHFASGMEWLSKFVRAEIRQETRNMTRGPSRPIPSRGGGLLT